MSRLLKSVALLLATLWLPATVHCQLETLGLDAVFACADTAAPNDHADGASCGDESCQTIEAGQVTLAKSRDVAALTLACIVPFCVFEIPAPSPAPGFVPLAQDVTLPLQRTWQFARRAALPGRAPDSLNV